MEKRPRKYINPNYKHGKYILNELKFFTLMASSTIGMIAGFIFSPPLWETSDSSFYIFMGICAVIPPLIIQLILTGLKRTFFQDNSNNKHIQDKT